MAKNLLARRVGGGAVLVLTTGLFVQQLWVHWPEQSARIARFGEVASQPLAARWTALEHAVRYVTGRDYEMIYGRDDSAEWQLRRLLSLCLSLALSVALGMGVARAIYRVVARAPDAAYWLMVLAWWSIPVAALTVTRHPAHIVYLLLTVPAGFMLAAPLLAPLTRYRLGQIFLVAWVFNCFWLIRADRAAVAARPVGEGLDRLSLNALPRFQSTVTQLVTEHHTAEMYVSLDEASLTAKAGRALKAISWSDVPTMTLFLLEQSAIYARGEGSEALPPIPLARREAKLDEAGGDAIVFDVIPAYTRAELAGLPQHRVDWPTEQGVTLIGYDVEPDDSRLTTYWLVETLADARGLWLYAPYAHVINEAGQIIANVGGPGLPGYYYRANEVYVTRITLPELPAGVYQLEVGLYDGVHGFGVTFMPPGAPPQPAYTAPLTWP